MYKAARMTCKLCCIVMLRSVYCALSVLMLHSPQHMNKPMNPLGERFLCLPKGKCANQNCWVQCLVNLSFAYGFWMDSSCLIFPLKACCALLRVSGTVSWAQQTLLATLLPISLFTALEKPWLYCTISPDFIYVRDYTQTPKLFMVSWMGFAGRHKSVHKHTHSYSAHTQQRVPFLQAMAPLILSDLKFVCSLLQRAPSMIPGSPRAPLRYHPSTFISLTPLSRALLRLEQLPDYTRALHMHSLTHTNIYIGSV